MDKSMVKYIVKRILLMFLTFFIIVAISFFMVRALPRQLPQEKNLQAVLNARFEALGYNEPLLTQFFIYIKNIVTDWDFGTSWYIQFRASAWDVLMSRMLPTILVNLYSFVLSVPIGIALGILAAVKKNTWIDQFISTAVMIFVSVPSYVYAFFLQYLLYYKLGWFPSTVYALADADGSWLSAKMFYSMVLPVLALSFGQIAGLTRYTRAELTETLTSDYMLLARTKGLTRTQATVRHALKNAMVPILPMIISTFIGILGGSMIIETIFSIPGTGNLFLRAINLFDYDVFMMDTVFYVFIGLMANIVVDISYGFIDPRIRMGQAK